MPSSSSGPRMRSKSGTSTADRISEAKDQSTSATSTATADLKQLVNQRNKADPDDHGNGLVNGSSVKPNGILSDRKTTGMESDEEQESNSRELKTIIWHQPVSPSCPSFATAKYALLTVRALAAFYSNISDCDEVFNYWEPMHYLQYGTGLATWEYSPVYAIRSWAYIFIHALPAEIVRLALSANRPQVFFILRIILGAVSAHCEATLYRAVVEEVDPRIGRYIFLALISSAGTWIASNAFLPSTLAMYTTMLFFSQMLKSPSQISAKRTFLAIFWVGLGALLGWPFSAAVGLPFALEELLIHSRDHTKKKKTVRFQDWRLMRLLRLITSSIVVLGCILVPILIIDHYYYKRLVIVPLNIVLYNVFGGDVGPDIFGTEPWWFYILNGLLNFNLLFLGALASLPILYLSYFTIPDELPNASALHGIKNPLLWYTLKLMPFYLWFAIFTAQPHKEERFLFVVYPLICFNAVMSLFLVQKLVQRVLNRFVVRSKTAAIHKYSAGLVWVILVLSAVISVSRILALHSHYNAPIEVYRKAFDLVKVPEPINVGTNGNNIEGSPDRSTVVSKPSLVKISGGKDDQQLAKPSTVRVCVGKEWYRFPSHYFLPEGAKIGFLKSHFDGLLPGEFLEYDGQTDLPPMPSQPSANKDKAHQPIRIDWRWSADRRPGASFVSKLMNNKNQEVQEFYTPLDQCHYLIDLDYSGRTIAEGIEHDEDAIEPRYLQNKQVWEKLYCHRYLDTQVGAGRNRWVRAFWMPAKWTFALTRGQSKVWGDYCIAKRRSVSAET